MNKNKIIFISILVIVAAGVFVFLKSGFGLILIHPAQKEPLPPKITIESMKKMEEEAKIREADSYRITYTADGKIDTSNWTVYRGEMSGYLLKAPKEHVTIGVGPVFMSSDQFTFIADKEGHAISAYPIVKNKGSNLSNWIENYIVDYPEKIIDRKIITVGKFQALEFNVKNSSNPKDHTAVPHMRWNDYPDFYDNNKTERTWEISDHYVIVDSGDRYLVFSNSTTSDQSYLDTYYAIMSSLEVFTPQKL